MDQKRPLFIPVILSVFLIILNSFFGFWWVNLLIAFFISYIFINRYTISFLLFFFIVFVLWTATSFWKDAQVNYGVSLFLSGIGGNINPNLTYLITGFIGGFLTGWAGLLGRHLRKITTSKTSNS